MGPKKLFKGKFNWKGEVHTLWTHSHCKHKAKQAMIVRLANVLDVVRLTLAREFDGDRDNFSIKEMIKDDGDN